jgi:hypothetical protein
MSTTALTDHSRPTHTNPVRRAVGDYRRAAWLAGGMVVAAAIVAVGITAFAAAPIRHWLDFPFGGIPPHVSQIVAVLANNLRLLGGLLAASVMAQLALRANTPGTRVLAMVCDAIIVLACANHVFLVGATIGGYGTRGLDALLPHGPIELAAYSLALSLYVACRRERMAPARALTIAGLSAVVLTIAAVVEVMA